MSVASNARSRAFYAENRQQILARNRVKYVERRARELERRRELRREVRLEMLAAYGGACECCGENEASFLDLDHVFGGGAAEKREVSNGGGDKYYRWLRKQGWPRVRLQLLCSNCNQGRARNAGVCPHADKGTARMEPLERFRHQTAASVPPHPALAFMEPPSHVRLPGDEDE